MKTEIVLGTKRKWRQKPTRQLEIVTLEGPALAVAVQKRPRAIAAAVQALLFKAARAVVALSSGVGPQALVREIGPGVHPMERAAWEPQTEKGVLSCIR